MPTDNTLQNGTANIAADDVTTLNGGASAGVLVARGKVGYGDDGTYRDVSPSFPLPSYVPDVTTSGTLTAATQTVVLAMQGMGAASVQITGTWVGTITFESSNDGTNWVPINGVSAASSTAQTTATVNGMYRLTPAGVKQIRANMTALTSGSAVVTMNASVGTGGTFANQVLPMQGTGIAGTPAGNVLSVQGVAGGTQQPVVSRVASLTQTAGAITTTTSTVTATTDIANAGTVTVGVFGTYVGVNFVFEVSMDGTNWFPIMGQRTDSYVTETSSGVLPANQFRAWDIPLPGFTQFRVRATAWTSGSATIVIAPAVNPFEIAPTVGIAGASNSGLTSVNLSLSSQTALAANLLRKGAKFFNDSGNTVWLAETASAATTAAYTVQIPAGGFYEIAGPSPYTGAVTFIATTATGSLKITETF